MFAFQCLLFLGLEKPMKYQSTFKVFFFKQGDNRIQKLSFFSKLRPSMKPGFVFNHKHLSIYLYKHSTTKQAANTPNDSRVCLSLAAKILSFWSSTLKCFNMKNIFTRKGIRISIYYIATTTLRTILRETSSFYVYFILICWYKYCYCFS